MGPVICFWFRRDLRLHDNVGLYRALHDAQKQGLYVLPVFIFDNEILEELPESDTRVTFIYQTISYLRREFISVGSGFEVRHGHPLDVWEQLLNEYGIRAIYTNRDFEPYAKHRDKQVAELAAKNGVDFKGEFKDHVLFCGDEILTDAGKPYTVYTPYKNKVIKTLQPNYAQLDPFPSEKWLHQLVQFENPPKLLTITELGFQLNVQSSVPAARLPDYEQLTKYAEGRNFPAVPATTRMSVHLRFGTVSIRQLAQQAIQANSESYLNELIWRDFYAMILDKFPHVITKAFKPAYDRIAWRHAPDELKSWQSGETGYPLVDAGMRELNATGYMHNRVRMVVASFLTKHLLIDWRQGEQYFALKLNDFDLSSNNGGWQWAAGSGCDAAPYFRVFNPSEQAKKFDPNYEYIRKWVPEFDGFGYPKPMIEHGVARDRALRVYREAVGPQTH